MFDHSNNERNQVLKNLSKSNKQIILKRNQSQTSVLSNNGEILFSEESRNKTNQKFNNLNRSSK